MLQAPHPQYRIMRGIVLRLATAAIFAMMAALLKLAAAWGAGLGELVFLRSFVGMLVVLAWVFPREGLKGIAPYKARNLVGRSAIGLVAMTLSFEALVLLPLAEAITIGFTAPIFATFLSWLLLREQVGIHRWLAAAVAFAGVIIVMRPGAPTAGAIAPLGVALALTAALFAGGVSIAVRHIAGVESIAAISFWFQLAGSGVGLLLMAAVGISGGTNAVLVLILAGMLGGLAQLLATASLHAAPVSVLAPFDYLQLIFAAALGWLFVGTAPTVFTWAGGLLITASGLYTAWREHKLSRSLATPPTI